MVLRSELFPVSSKLQIIRAFCFRWLVPKYIIRLFKYWNASLFVERPETKARKRKDSRRRKRFFRVSVECDAREPLYYDFYILRGVSGYSLSLSFRGPFTGEVSDRRGLKFFEEQPDVKF